MSRIAALIDSLRLGKSIKSEVLESLRIDYLTFAAKSAKNNVSLSSKSFGLSSFAGLCILEDLTSLRDLTELKLARLDKTSLSSEPTINYGRWDFSYDNNFAIICYYFSALISGELRIAEKIASLVWPYHDDEFLAELGFATKSDNAAAHAIKHIIDGRRDLALAELTKIPSLNATKGSRRAYVDINLCRDMLIGFAKDDPEVFLIGLHRLLEGHEKHARRSDNKKNSWYSICIGATALSLWALYRGVITRDRLPDDSPFLPLELIDFSLNNISWAEHLEFRVLEAPMV